MKLKKYPKMRHVKLQNVSTSITPSVLKPDPTNVNASHFAVSALSPMIKSEMNSKKYMRLEASTILRFT